MHFRQWKRREFITLFGGAAAWPLAARAQQPNRMRRIGVLTPYPADEPEGPNARLTAFAQASRGGLIVGGRATIHRGVIIALAAKHRLPAVYTLRYLAAAGGLISYGPDLLDQHRRAAGYVDRILRGEKPADLPVQAPTKYELVINLKTAKALGLTVPESLLAR